MKPRIRVTNTTGLPDNCVMKAIAMIMSSPSKIGAITYCSVVFTDFCVHYKKKRGVHHFTASNYD